MAGAAAVLIPIKSFAGAKARLASALTAEMRSDLARAMAATVVGAAHGLPVAVVCDDDEVARWAAGQGARALRTPAEGLNAAVRSGFGQLLAEGFDLVIVAHGDLPFAERLDRLVRFDGVTLVPDRRDDGTNVVGLPAAVPFEFSYGPGSFRRHVLEARRWGAPLRIARVPSLQWDVDTVDDLPESAGAAGGRGAVAAAT